MLIDALTAVQPYLFPCFAGVAFAQWLRHRAAPGAWLVAAFTTMAIFTVGVSIVPEQPEEAYRWIGKLLVALIFLFPLFLYRFMASLIRPVRWIEIAAVVLTAAAIVATLLLPDVDNDSPLMNAYIALLLGQWLFLTYRVFVRLWRAGWNQPPVVRRRMRVMALGAAGLALTAVLATEFPDPTGGMVQSLAFVPAALLLIGYAPPYALRMRWRREDARSTRNVERALMAATTVEEVVDTLLPHARRMLGAFEVTLEDLAGQVIGRDRSSIDDEDIGPKRTPEVNRAHVVITTDNLRMQIQASALTPFFGREEIERLESLTALAGLALNRNALLLERQRFAEEAARQSDRANRAKSEFLSRMSHELRTPLNAILGFGQLLEMDSLTPDQRDSLDQMVKGGRRLLELINEVLDISRIESGTMQLSVEPVPVASVVEDAVALIRPLADERGIRLRTDLPETMTRTHAFADQQRFGQILLNLLSNAVKYNVTDGAVSVTGLETENSIRIGVTDTGPGIPDDKIPLLFTPFERLGADGSGVEGTGLGLSLSKSLVEAMGGHLEVDTMMGEGTTFWVELRKAESPPVDEEPGTEAEPDSIHPRILYIEDNLSNLKLIERLLHGKGIEVMSAMTGALGLDMAQQHRPDLILLDVHLPDLGGEEILIRLRKDPRTKMIPVIILSADATSGQVKRLRAAGADDYVTKPIDVAEFLGVVDRMLAA